MAKKPCAVIPVTGHTPGRPVEFKDGPALDAWFSRNHGKIVKWAQLTDERFTKTIVVFFHDDEDAEAMLRLAP
ncbi:hypothetical protein ABIC83_002848 [Roseateles asaccharophilus]|uniref:hypothetical protein n=1 Tax=Roseateles asaccharophilus TaxID=582607 RepID=UPI003836167C